VLTSFFQKEKTNLRVFRQNVKYKIRKKNKIFILPALISFLNVSNSTVKEMVSKLAIKYLIAYLFIQA